MEVGKAAIVNRTTVNSSATKRCNKMALWGGRFQADADELLKKLNDSIHFDRRFYAEDIAGSIAYANALFEVGILDAHERDSILKGLNQVKREFDDNAFELVDSDEDIHSAVERRLTELIGATAGKLHTARSRNDQVATDFRLYVLGAIETLDVRLSEFQKVLVEKAEGHIHTLMPGYTHLQPAQPITAAHWLLSYFWMIARDRERLRGCRRRTSVLPLGSGALAGTPLQINRQRLAEELGFDTVSENSLDSVSDRDFVAEFLFSAATISIHLSRLGEDIILYSNPAFGFVVLNDRYSTGSSLMPQKRNADPMELARGKAGRIIGNLTGFLATLKSLPSGYNKDLQEDKEALFDTVDTLMSLLPVLTAVVYSLTIDVHRAREALTDDMLATDLADYLVHKGIPFREAHHLVGQVVRTAEEAGITLSQVPMETLKSISEVFGDDVLDCFDFDRSVANRSADGGTAPDAVLRQISAAYRWLSVATEL